jgi:hypothetical protein
LHAKTKAVAERSESHYALSRFAAFFVRKGTVISGFHARVAKLGQMKTDGSYCYCDTFAQIRGL